MRRLLFTLVALAGCSAAVPSVVRSPAQFQALPANSFPAMPHATLPPEILYTLGGGPRDPKPYINVFNAADASPSPKPLYTIPPDGFAGFGLLAVDSSNHLFAEKFFPSGGGKLYMFPPAKTKPTTTCILNTYSLAMYVTHGILYLASGTSTITEYSDPLPPGSTCPKPLKTLTDERAKRFGSSLLGLVVDPYGNVFVDWVSSQHTTVYMDEFPGGSHYAKPFANLGQSYSSDFTSDRNGNIITDLYKYKGSTNDCLAVFPHGSNQPKLFFPTASAYGAKALAKNDTELFVIAPYPSVAVHIFTYNPRTGNLGYEEQRSFPNPWGDSIAVFSQ